MKVLRLFRNALFIAICAGFVGCGEEEVVDDKTVSESKQTEQKQKLSDIATELLNKVDASDFKNLSKITDVISSKIETDNTDVLDNWVEACLNLCQVSSSPYNEKYIYTISNFKGQFERNQNRWEQTGNDDYLQFTFNDNAIGVVVLKLTTSGKKTQINHEWFNDEEWEWNYNTQEYDITTIENHFVIPEYITVTLTQNGKTLVETTLTTKLTIDSPMGEINPGTDIAEVSFKSKVNNYEVVVDKCYFNASKNASVSASLTVGGERLITASASAEGRLREDIEGSEGNIAVTADVLGKVQLRGSIKTVNDFISTFDDMESEEYENNERLFFECVDKCNNLMDISLFFDGSQEPSASLGIEGLQDKYDNEYYPILVVKFPDSTSYALLEEYFSETYFKSVIRQFESLIEGFEDFY